MVGTHRAPQEGDDHLYNDGYHNTVCYSGYCDAPDNKHPYCGGSIALAVDAVQDAVRAGSEKRLFALADENDSIRIDEDGGVELLDCRRELIGYIPGRAIAMASD